MRKTLATLALAGFLFVRPFPDGHLTVGEDTTGNGYEDTRKVYILKGIDGKNKMMVYEHIGTFRDYNDDKQFTEDEYSPIEKEKTF